ncbi:MAG: methyltransferase [Candidatus Sedimenticola sp. 20ELBAFRAG]
MPFRVRYRTIEFGETDIHVRTLRDRQQFSDSEGVASRLGISSATWPLFGVIWDSGQVLAHLMFDYEIQGKRILEVGCGIGLASLVLNHRLADITATDHHPEAGSFLKINVKLNDGDKIPFIRSDWGDDDNDLGLFDLIIGSDLLYERDHIGLLSDFIDHHAKAHCEVIIVDPGRRQQSAFTKKMLSIGYTFSKNRPETSDYLEQPFKGQVLHYQR